VIQKYHRETPLYSYPQIREWKLGILQDRSYQELEQNFPEYVRMLQNEAINFPVPDGESRLEFQVRVNQAVQVLAERSPGKCLLVVTHGGVLVRLYRFLGGEVPASGKITGPGNASVTQVKYDHETKVWTLVAWNQIYSPQAEFYKSPPAL
jgi:broad specificity phosphatase PhoE